MKIMSKGPAFFTRPEAVRSAPPDFNFVERPDREMFFFAISAWCGSIPGKTRPVSGIALASAGLIVRQGSQFQDFFGLQFRKQVQKFPKLGDIQGYIFLFMGQLSSVRASSSGLNSSHVLVNFFKNFWSIMRFYSQSS